MVKSGRQGSNLQDLRPKHSVITNRLLPVYLLKINKNEDALEMFIFKNKKQSGRLLFIRYSFLLRSRRPKQKRMIFSSLWLNRPKCEKKFLVYTLSC